MRDRQFQFLIDVVGSCNLRCPSCAVGNMARQNRGGVMSPETLDAILTKAESECQVATVALYNWTEPLLHPKLPEMIRLVESRGIRCYLSSNLNIIKNHEAVLAANPYSLRLSLSGFTQENYTRTHTRGNIEQVKANMVTLAETKKSVQSTTKICVLFHRYLHNLDDEEKMREFAENLGFKFTPVWAYLMPLEKVLALVDPESETTLTDSDREIISMFAMPVEKVLQECAEHRELPCSLLSDQVVIDCHGNTMLCCGGYDAEKMNVGKYLETPLAELQARRETHSVCDTCTKHGAHVYGSYAIDDIDKMSRQNVADKLGAAGARKLYSIAPPRGTVRHTAMKLRSAYRKQVGPLKKRLAG